MRSQRHEAVKSLDSDGLPDVLAIVGGSEDRAAVASFARSNGLDVTVVGTLEEAFRISTLEKAALIILDRDLAESDWRSTVHSLAQRNSTPCIILASSVLDDYLFEEIVRQGGFDIVAKPILPDELRRIGGLALTFWKSRTERQP